MMCHTYREVFSLVDWNFKFKADWSLVNNNFGLGMVNTCVLQRAARPCIKCLDLLIIDKSLCIPGWILCSKEHVHGDRIHTVHCSENALAITPLIVPIIVANCDRNKYIFYGSEKSFFLNVIYVWAPHCYLHPQESTIPDSKEEDIWSWME